MRKITLCLPYYCNQGMLRLQYERLQALPHDIKRLLAVIVVDDGSPNGDALPADIGCPLSIYKIGVDVRWNQDAARNIAAHHAETPWLLLTDIDHLVPRETLAYCCSKLSVHNVYRFARETLESCGDTTPYKPHPNSWLMTRDMYEKIGGYDERFAGYYGTDADFRDGIQKAGAMIVQLNQTLIRVPRTVVPDASTTTYGRKEPQDVAIKAIRANRNQQKDWRPVRLSFPYRKIYPC